VSDDLPDGDQQASVQTDMKQRAEFISGVLTTLLEEEGTQAFEQLLGTKSVEKAMELQQVYFKNAYEGFVTHATKIGTLYADLVKETYKPFEGYVAKITPAK
jgi:hypothetical protein